MDEKELVNRCLRGDQRAFEELVLKYQNKIYTLCYRYMGNEEDAYDMAQEAFVKAYRSLHNFKGESSFGTWIYRITTNVCLDEMRRRKRRVIATSLDEPLDTGEGEVGKEVMDTAPPLDEIYERKEFSEYIQSLLNQMKPEHKAVVILRDMLDLSYEEIAGILNCSLGTVKSRLSRSRNLLRKMLLNREHLP